MARTNVHTMFMGTVGMVGFCGKRYFGGYRKHGVSKYESVHKGDVD